MGVGVGAGRAGVGAGAGGSKVGRGMGASSWPKEGNWKGGMSGCAWGRAKKPVPAAQQPEGKQPDDRQPEGEEGKAAYGC